MNAQHTPGTWHVGRIRGKLVAVYGEKGEQIADCESPSNGQGENKANARLIAQAPAMLEALEAIFKECAITNKHWGEGYNQKQADAAIKAGKDAIRQAKGDPEP